MVEAGVFKRIRPNDVSKTEFLVYKSWSLSETDFYNTSSVQRSTFLVAHKPNPNNYIGGVITTGSFQTITTPDNQTNSYIYVSESVNSGIAWYSLNHLYYRNPYTLNSFGNFNETLTTRRLHSTASIVSIPQSLYGRSIKPGSINGSISSSNETVTFYDDTYGNIRTTTYSASVESDINNFLYLGFDADLFKPVNRIENTHLVKGIVYKSVSVINSAVVDSYYNKPIGLSARFTGSGSYIQIPNSDITSPRNSNDFAISFWLSLDSLDATSAADYNWVISKNRQTTSLITVFGRVVPLITNTPYPVWPYEIKIANANVASGTNTTLYFTRSDGTNTYSLQTGISVKSAPVHCVCQKKGTRLQLYINGVEVDWINVNCSSDYENDYDTVLGNTSDGLQGFKGELDEVYFFNRSLDNDEILNLSDLSSKCNAVNSNIIGNVIYEQGIVTFTDTRPAMRNIHYSGSSWNSLGPGAMDIQLNFNSTLKINEMEVLCRAKKSELNLSSNPSLLQTRIGECQSTSNAVYSDIVSNPEWNPYITTIGLYNDNYELLAVAKLARPVPKFDTMDMNFLIRLDI
jgi:hypothetical protein